MLIMEGETPQGRGMGREELHFGANHIEFTSRHNNKQFSVTNQMDNGFNHGLIEIKENSMPYRQAWKDSDLALDPRSDRVTILGDLKIEGNHRRGMNNPSKSSMKIHPIESTGSGSNMLGAFGPGDGSALKHSFGNAVEIKHFFPREESKENFKGSGRSAKNAHFEPGTGSHEGSVHNSTPSRADRPLHHSKSIAVLLHERQ